MLSGLRCQRLHTLSTVVWMRIVYVEFTSSTIFLKQKLDLTKHVYDHFFFWIMLKLCQAGSKLQAMIWTWVQGTWIIRKGKENAFKSKSIKEAQSLTYLLHVESQWPSIPPPLMYKRRNRNGAARKGQSTLYLLATTTLKHVWLLILLHM
jgi:hypothetical protein